MLFGTARAAVTFSLSRDYSHTENSTNSTWSYRLEHFDHVPAFFPLLPRTDRSANDLWGSDFPFPPMMWSESNGYWGIGRNETGKEQFSSRNGTRWKPGEVLLHPKARDAPAGLVICWTAPSNMTSRVTYGLGRAAEQGNGIGYEITKRSGAVDLSIVALENIGIGITNGFEGLTFAKGDQLLFRFNTCGEPEGDITRVRIEIESIPESATKLPAVYPSGGTVAEGSTFIFNAPTVSLGKIQWQKNGQVIADATNGSYRIMDVKVSDSGEYSVSIDSVSSDKTTLNVMPKPPMQERYPSATPRQAFGSTLAGQEQELGTNKLMQRFAASRKRLAVDIFRPAYHFVSPESQMNDPNGLCFWQGRWHLFYQAYPPDEFPDPKDIPKRRQHWGHAVSEDLVHWRDLPYAIYPGIEKMCFSGSTVTETNQVVAFYPGIAAGQMIAIAKDPLLLNWEKLGGKPVRGTPTGDSCIWKEGETYRGLVGADTLVSSTNLLNWRVNGSFLEGASFPLGDAGACPNFVPIGNKHILLSFSHTTSGQYLLGDYDQQRHKFKPYAHGRFNHGTVSPGGVHAPSAAADGKGGVVNILNINDAKPSPDWDQIMSLAQHLTLGSDSQLLIEPVDAVKSLRRNHQHVEEMVLRANRELVLKEIQGNTMELAVEIEPQLSRWVQLNLLRSPNAEEQTSITFYNFDRKLSIWYHTKSVICLDGSRSSTSADVWLRPPERVTVEQVGRDSTPTVEVATPGNLLNLRVFVDRSVVEVFVNQRLYLAMRVYPSRRDSIGVSVRAQGQDAVLKKLDAWQMNSIW